MCPEPRWIDYPAPRSPADSFVMAGPIIHCLLQACYSAKTDFHAARHFLIVLPRVPISVEFMFCESE